MGLIDNAKEDIENITSDLDGFAVEMKLTAPTGQIVDITGLHTKIHLGVNTEGEAVNSKKAHVSFSEKFLTDANYPVRNSSGEVSIIKHLVDVKDSTGEIKNYRIQEAYPDETIGLIVCILEDYE